MAAFNKIPDWLDTMLENADLASDQFVIATSNTAPAAEGSDPSTDGNGVLANVTENDYTNCSSRNITTSSSSQASGTYALVLADIVLTTSGGTLGPLQYVYVYDDTVAVPADPLVCYYDYGSEITLAEGETLTIDFSATGLFTVTT